MSGDLPEPGSFLTLDDFGVPVLAVRDDEGTFRAFVNVCRHRGVLLESEKQGQRSKFSCPFHGWTYSSRGDLVAIRKKSTSEKSISRATAWCLSRPLSAMDFYG